MSDGKRRGFMSNAKLIQRIVGAIITILGLALFVIGLVFLRNDMPYWFVMFIGLSVAVMGSFLFVFGFQRESSKYVMTEHLEESEYPTAEHVETYIRAAIVCECGQVNDAGSDYCKKCGKSLRKVCGKCGASVPVDAEFCDKCGAPMSHDN